MKIFLLVVIFLLTVSNSDAQWIIQNSGTNQNLYDVEFLNENTGWALGDGGVVIKTTNGGLNWINVPNPAVNKPLSSIHIVNENVIYFVGWFETIIKTTNGGDNWIVIRNGTLQGASYDALYFIDENTGWIAGTGNKVLKTTNGGQTLDSIYLLWGDAWDMYFKDANTGLLCATGNVFKTTNGGINWFEANIPLGGNFPLFRKIAVADDMYTWVIGNNSKEFRSTDFGSNWQLIDTVSTETGIHGLCFLNRDTGFAGGAFNTLFRTTDGGFSWTKEKTDTNTLAFISSIEFVTDSIGWYVGGAGKTFHTTTGGEILTSVLFDPVNIPESFMLFQNYPNPFNPATTIGYIINSRGNVNLTVFNVTGKIVKELVNGKQSEGKYQILFDGNTFPSGVYYYRLEVNNQIISTKKMVLVK